MNNLLLIVATLYFAFVSISNVQGQTTPNEYPEDEPYIVIQEPSNPVYHAIHNESLRILQHLIREGIDVNILGEEADPEFFDRNNQFELSSKVFFRRGTTPLLYASGITQNIDIINTLLDNGADINAVDSYGCTALIHAAISNPSPEVISLLINRGADVNHAMDNGHHPLIAAIRNNQSIDVIQILIDAGADVNKKRHLDGASPLIIAALRNEDIRITKALIDAGADVLAQSIKGNTALSQACVNNHNPEVILLLIQSGAEINRVRSHNNNTTPLMIAAIRNTPGVIRKLIEQGAKLDAQTTEGQSALIIASAQNAGGVIQTLLDAGANINLQDNQGRTPLIWASEYNNEFAVETLLNAKADVKIRDIQGNTALDYAYKNEALINTPAIKALEDASR